jgi:hypothetical protein
VHGLHSALFFSLFLLPSAANRRKSRADRKNAKSMFFLFKILFENKQKGIDNTLSDTI